NQALEIFETISREPETEIERKLHKFFESLVECGAKVIVTEDVRLSHFVRKIPKGMEFSGKLDLYNAPIETISNITVGDRLTLDGNHNVKSFGPGIVAKEIIVNNAAQGFSIDSATAEY